MISLMNSLETRFFNKGELINNEMEECLEIIFVELGMYEIGFEINKKQFMSIRFGMSTIIGGF